MNIILKYIANTIGDKTEPCLIPYLIPLPRTLFFHRRSLLRLFAELRKNYSADFHEIWWKGDTWATEEVQLLFITFAIKEVVFWLRVLSVSRITQKVVDELLLWILIKVLG